MDSDRGRNSPLPLATERLLGFDASLASAVQLVPSSPIDLHRTIKIKNIVLISCNSIIQSLVHISFRSQTCGELLHCKRSLCLHTTAARLNPTTLEGKHRHINTQSRPKPIAFALRNHSCKQSKRTSESLRPSSETNWWKVACDCHRFYSLCRLMRQECLCLHKRRAMGK